jgi:CRISPR-associated protein Cas1
MFRSSVKSHPPTIKRTLEISGFDAALSIRNGILTLKRGQEIVAQVPTVDLGVLVVDTPNATFTTSALLGITEAGGLVILCGRDHMPTTFILPVVGNELQVARKLAQLELPRPTRKRVWQQLVRAKIHNQALASPDEEVRKRLQNLASHVKSGDPDNMEAQAARIYWSRWLGGQPFTRDRYGDQPNNFLNYGYMVLRGVVARALVAAGLDCTFGLHHVGRSSGFPLADDFMEPLRPWVDCAARELHSAGAAELDKSAKTRLLRTLYEPCWFGDERSTLAVATERMVGTYVRVLMGENKTIVAPRMPTPEEVWTYAEKSAPPQEQDGTRFALE